tara:strand:+ start:268 stop:492 length:225 start_codon:yes stop_codon:yes gene_type:complete
LRSDVCDNNYSEKNRRDEMSKMSNWMIDMDEQIGLALEMGATTTNSVIAFAKTNMHPVDEKYIERQMTEIMGEF